MTDDDKGTAEMLTDWRTAEKALATAKAGRAAAEEAAIAAELAQAAALETAEAARRALEAATVAEESARATADAALATLAATNVDLTEKAEVESEAGRVEAAANVAYHAAEDRARDREGV